MSGAVSLHAVMTEAQYDAARAELAALYGNTLNEMVARRDQALARLFARSGWTQEKIAKKEGKSQSWVSYRLVFGRFLEFTTIVVKPENLPRNLTEGRFRELWKKADHNESNERIRFQQVLEQIHDNTVLVTGLGRKLGVGPKIMEHFADGQWHWLDTIVETTGASEDVVKRTLDGMMEKGSYNSKCETRLKGKEQKPQYCIFSKEKSVSSTELAEKLGPLIKDLKIEGKKNMATMVPAVVAMIAEQLQRLLDEWTL